MVDAYGNTHISGGQRSVVITNIGLVEEFAEIDVRAAKTAVEDAGKGKVQLFS